MSYFLTSVIALCTLTVCASAHAKAHPAPKRLEDHFPLCPTKLCTCTEDTADCSIINDGLKQVPSLPSNIRIVYFENKILQILSQSTFNNIMYLNLTELHLKRNGIVGISEDAFTYFRHLQVLDLSDNVYMNVNNLSKALGSIQTTQMITIVMQKVGLKELPYAFFHQMNDSKVHLDLGRNEINTLNMSVFEHLKFLKAIYIEDNELENVTTPPSGSLAVLETLSLRGNRLVSQPMLCSSEENETFARLQHLIMSHNYIGELNSRNWVCLKSLVRLDIHRNRIKHLQMSAFETLPFLKILDVRANWIETVSPNNGSTTLEIINLGQNELPWPPCMCTNDSTNNLFPKLLHLNISHNYIKAIKPKSLDCLKTLTNLSLSGNVMRTLRNNSFSNLKKLTYLEMAKMQGKIETIEPLAFNNSNLKLLNLESNNVMFAADKTLFVIFEHCKNLTHLDLSHNSFRHLNETEIIRILSPLKQLQTLVLQKISLNRLPVGFLNIFHHLSSLNLNENIIIDEYLKKTFNTTTNLKNVYLRKNYIRIIQKDTFPGSLQTSLELLDLSYNPFDCNCDMLWFRTWLDNGKTNILNKWPYGYKCQTPPALSGTLFKDYHPTPNSCKPLDPMIVAYATIGSFVFVFTLVAAVLFRNRLYVMYCFYKLKRQRTNTDPEMNPLLDKSNTVYDVMADGIYASRNAIAVVSKHFLRDSFCQFQLDVSLDRQVELKRDYLILVILDDVDFKVLSKNWCVMLTKMPTAYWCADKQHVKRHVFEERLKEHLGTPINNPGHLQSSSNVT